MSKPQSFSAVLEDDAFDKPELAEGEEVSTLTEFEEDDDDGTQQPAKAPAKQQGKAKVVDSLEATPAPAAKSTPAAEEIVDAELPEDLKGKTPSQLAKMYKDAQSVIGRQGQELGQLRGLSDRLLKSTLAPAAPTARPAAPAATAAPSFSDADFFAKPGESIAQAIANHPSIKRIEEALGKTAQERAVSRAEQAMGRFNAAHPDAAEILGSQDFQGWVVASPVRQQLFKSAHDRYDFDAGNELFTTYKELRGIRAKAKADEAIAAEQAAAAQQTEAAAKAKAQAQAAKVPTGGNATGGKQGGKGKPVYRRADLMELRMNNPERYEALSAEIDAAYREGRVR